MLTTIAALQKGVVSLDDTSKSPTASTSAAASSATPTASTAAAPSAKRSPSRATPTSPRSGRRSATTTSSPRRNGSASTLRRASTASEVLAEIEPAEPTIPTDIGEEVDLGVTAIGQGEVLATPLMMASIAQAIANDGVLEPTSLVPNKKLRPGREAGPGDVEEDRRRADRTDDRRRHRRDRIRRGDPGGPGRRQDRYRRARAGAGPGELARTGADQGRLVRRLRPRRRPEARRRRCC